jgi:hypothetical protein
MLFTKKYVILLLLCLTTAVAFAQNKAALPARFAHLSDNITVKENTLSEAFSKQEGQNIDFNFNTSFNFPGTVISQKKVYDNLYTIIVRSSDFNKAMMQLSKQLKADGTVLYTGKIFSNGGSDGFSIVPDGKGNYLLQKFETALVLQDCHLQ